MITVTTSGNSVSIVHGNINLTSAKSNFGWRRRLDSLSIEIKFYGVTIFSAGFGDLTVDGTVVDESNADSVLADLASSEGGGGSGLTPELEAKLDAIIIDGDGNSYLTNNGSYQQIAGGPAFITYPTKNDFPITGEDGLLYLDASTGNLYFWDGTEYDITDEGFFNNYLPLVGGKTVNSFSIASSNKLLLRDWSTVETTNTAAPSIGYSPNGGLVISGVLDTQGDLTTPNNVSIKTYQNNGSINLDTTNTPSLARGKAYYNGSEIATLNDIPDTSDFVKNNTNSSLNILTEGAGIITFGGGSANMNLFGDSIALDVPSRELATINGAQIATIDDDSSGIVWVNGSYTGSILKGTIFQPYKTILAGINNASSYKNILVAPGTYNENISFVGKTGISLKALSPIGNRPNVEVNGSLIIDSTSTRIGIHGISFDGEAILDSTGSNDYYLFVNFNAAVILQGTGYSSFRTCWFNGLTWMEGNVEMNTCYDEDNSAWSLLGDAIYTFGCRNGYGLVIAHVNGNVDIVDSFFATDSTGVSITSTANTGRLILTGGTVLQLDGTYGTINKLGLCEYAFGTLVHEEIGLTLNGQRTDSGLHGNQIYVHNSTPGYTRRPATNYIAKDSLNAHLLGISDKFVELTNLRTLKRGDVSTSTSTPITADVGDTGITLTLLYNSDTVSNLYATASTPILCEIRRASIYGSTAQGSFYSGTLSTTALLIDDILLNGTDSVWITIRTANSTYRAEVIQGPLFGAEIYIEKIK